MLNLLPWSAVLQHWSHCTFPLADMSVVAAASVLARRLVRPMLATRAKPFSPFVARTAADDAGGIDSGGPAAEARLQATLRRRFPGATEVAVADVSGGCGPMFEGYVEAPDFRGLRVVRQHQPVTEALKEEIREMHGDGFSTSTSP